MTKVLVFATILGMLACSNDSKPTDAAVLDATVESLSGDVVSPDVEAQDDGAAAEVGVTADATDAAIPLDVVPGVETLDAIILLDVVPGDVAPDVQVVPDVAVDSVAAE